jgi:hypothetical protein
MRKSKVLASVFVFLFSVTLPLFAADCGCSYTSGYSKVTIDYECGAASGRRTATDIRTGKPVGEPTTLDSDEVSRLCSGRS